MQFPNSDRAIRDHLTGCKKGVKKGVKKEYIVRTWVCCFDGDNVFCLRNTGARAGPTTVWALWTQDNRGPHGRNRSPSPCSQKNFKGCGWVGSFFFFWERTSLEPNGRMCAPNSLLPPFPTNPLSQHRNTLCAHGCVVLMETMSFVCATRGRARDLLRSGHSGPKTIADLMAAIVPRPALCASTPLPSGPNALLVFTSFTGVSPAPHGAFSLMTRVS